jgi:hypothetical protein
VLSAAQAECQRYLRPALIQIPKLKIVLVLVVVLVLDLLGLCVETRPEFFSHHFVPLARR